MTLSSLMHALDDVGSDLPFAVGNYEAANALYRRWRQTGSREDHDLLVKWLFCYTRRYFITKWIHQADLPVADMDGPITQAFNRSRKHLESVESHDCFASYVSVICKNTFLNFCRRRQRHPSLPLEALPLDDEAELPPDPFEAHDRAVVISAVHRAIDRLPEWLRVPARLRLIERLDYEQISERTGHPCPIVRSYVSKALARLRNDPELALFMDEWRE